MERLFRFQLQTRRLLPRNSRARAIPLREDVGFNRRRDACFLATKMKYCTHCGTQLFQSQTRRLLPRNAYGPNAARRETGFNRRRDACFLATGINSLYGKTVQVSIADATLASSQHTKLAAKTLANFGFNRRRDACFLATPPSNPPHQPHQTRFNRRRDACFLATWVNASGDLVVHHVSIADATLASSQHENS